MPFDDILRDMVPKYIRLSKTEAKVLDTLITMKSGNAYSSWKTSGLKHYPTVLRALKKLEKKSLVKILSKSGARGERIYAPTIAGTFISYIFDREEKKIVKMVAENSSLFRKLSEIEKNDDLAFYAVRDILWNVYRKEKLVGINEAVETRVGEEITGWVMQLDEHAQEWILKRSKIKWVRERAIREVESYRIWLRQQMRDVEEFNKKLEQAHW